VSAPRPSWLRVVALLTILLLILFLVLRRGRLW
jgi:high-affinity Fe2+/Pb2+ permease